MKVPFVRFILVIIILIPNVSLGQGLPTKKELINQSIIWYRYQNRLILNDKWELVSHIDNRRFLSAGHLLNTWVFRIQPIYNINNKVAVSQSYVFFLQSPNEPVNGRRLMVPEHRPYQELSIKNDLGKVAIRHRYRLEERFFRKNDGEKLLPGYNFNWRFRYQLQAQRKLFGVGDGKAVHLRLAQELMFNFGKSIVYNTFDQHRLSAAFNLNLNKYLDIEAGYTHIFQQRPNGHSFFNRHVIRLALNHSIHLRKE